jgi:hypothetical protein
MSLARADEESPAVMVAEAPDADVHYFREEHCAYWFDPNHGERLRSVMVADRIALAGDPQCPREFMLLLSNDETSVREALAGNPRLTLRIMKRLARAGGSPSLVLARRTDTPPEVLGIIAAVATQSKRQPRWLRLNVHEEVLRVVLRRPDCPTDTLAAHAKGDWLSQRLVAANPSCPRDSLEHLAARGTGYTLAALVGNPEATATMLSWIVTRMWRSGLSHTALVRLIAMDWSLARPFVTATKAAHRQQLVRDSPSARAHMEADDDWRLRYAVAAADPDGQHMRNLAADPHGRVRRAATQRLLALVSA